MKITRRTTLGMLLATAATPVLAGQAPVFEGNGAAINGFDPVAYFTEGKPVRGAEQFSTNWNGSTWRFASAENKAAFDAAPEDYAPQYGGYCAYAVSKGYTASTDPDAWSIHDDKLYLNYSKSVRFIWARDIPGNISKGDANWPGVLK